MTDDTTNTTPTPPADDSQIPTEPEGVEETHEHIAHPTAAGQIDERNVRITELEARLAETDNSWKRAVADLANYRRQADEDKQSFAKFAAEKTLLTILPVFDNFERLATHLPEEVRSSDTGTSFAAVRTQFEQALTSVGLEKIPLTVGDVCDPLTCQAIGTGPGEREKVIEIFEHGYRLGGKVIRTAKVRVGDGSSAAA